MIKLVVIYFFFLKMLEASANDRDSVEKCFLVKPNSSTSRIALIDSLNREKIRAKKTTRNKIELTEGKQSYRHCPRHPAGVQTKRMDPAPSGNGISKINMKINYFCIPCGATLRQKEIRLGVEDSIHSGRVLSEVQH